MAVLADFNFTIRRAEFERGLVTVPYGKAEYLYREENHRMPLKDAVAYLQQLSDAEPRSHYANFCVRYRDDVAPRGYGKARRAFHVERTVS